MRMKMGPVPVGLLVEPRTRCVDVWQREYPAVNKPVSQIKRETKYADMRLTPWVMAEREVECKRLKAGSTHLYLLPRDGVRTQRCTHISRADIFVLATSFGNGSP
jgi:hypothetical protein